MKQLIERMMIVCAVMALALPANAQFGGLGNAIKQHAKNKVEQKVRQKVYQATNPTNIADEISSAIPEKGDAKDKLECKVAGNSYKTMNSSRCSKCSEPSRKVLWRCR